MQTPKFSIYDRKDVYLFIRSKKKHVIVKYWIKVKSEGSIWNLESIKERNIEEKWKEIKFARE